MSTLGQHALLSTKFAFTERHVLFGKLRPNLGKVTLPGHSGICSTDILPVLPGPRLDGRFLAWFLRRPETTAWAAGRAAGANLPRLSPTELGRLPLPLPPIEEQRRIAAILDQADALRSRQREVTALLATLRRSIYFEMFDSQGTRVEWPTVALEDVVRSGTLVTYGIVQAGEEFPGGVPYIRTGDIQDGQILVNQLRRTDPGVAERFTRSRVDAGDIVMSIRATVGTTAVVPSELVGANLTQGTARISPGDRTLPTFLLQQLRADTVQRWIQAQVKGATFREITLGRLRRLPIVLPPISLQREFGVRVASLDRLHDRSQRAQDHLDDLFASLRDRAFKDEL